ncbi:MAG: hypothetical protein ACM3X8_05525, partial [Methanomicrobiales archaeon]
VTLFPVLLMQMPSIFFIPVMSSIIWAPFLIFGNGSPVILLSGALLIALLCGSLQYAYGKRLSGDRKWQYVLMILVTCVQTGFLLAVASIFIFSFGLF